jgi:predicted membrane protein (TIGR00267 family)
MELLHELEGAAFGLGDGVICALGMLVGAAAATSTPSTVIMVGVVGGIADAFGNAIGFYISQSAERGVQMHMHRKGEKVRIHSSTETVMNGVMSFISTILIFGILLLPYLFMRILDAVIVSCIIGAILLFLLGVYVGKISGEGQVKIGLIYAILGIAGAFLSYGIGELLGNFMGI